MSEGRIAVTGADGYIGRRVVARLPADRVVKLSRRKPQTDASNWAPFDLADPAPTLPPAVDAVIHLAADVTFSLTPEQELANLRGLLAAAKAASATFVLVSSQSAKSPLGEYGERKAAAETLVRKAGGVIVRPGLVIGGRRPKGLAAQLVKLGGFPLLPDFGPKAQVQAIHVEDLAEALIRVARGPGGRILELAGALMPLRALIARMAQRRRGGSPVFAPMPEFVVCALAGKARRGPRASLRQMFNLQPMQDDMGKLGLRHMALELAATSSNRPLRRALLVEGRMLLAVVGLKRPPASMNMRYARIIERDASPRAADLALLRKLGSAAIVARRDLSDLDELRRRLTLAVALFECSPEGAATVMRFQPVSSLGVFLGLASLGPAAAIDIIRTRLVFRARRPG